MAAELALAMKIIALVEGATDLEALKSSVAELGAEAGKPINDPTPPLREGAEKTRGVISELEAQLTQLATLGAIAGFVKTSVEAMRKAESAFRGLESISTHAGITIQESFQAAGRLASDGLLSVADASKSLQNLLSRGFTLDQAIATIERLKDAAAFNRQANLSMSEAVAQATEGLKNENSILVDNAGVTQNVAKMWEIYAKQIGVSTNDLTQAQKVQAEYNGILRETEAQVGNAKKAAEGFEGGIARLQQNSKELAAAFGGDLQPALNLIGSGLNFLVETAKHAAVGLNIVGASVGALFDSFDDIDAALQNLDFDGLGDKILAHFKVVGEIADDAVARYEGGLTPAIQGAIGQAGQLGAAGKQAGSNVAAGQEEAAAAADKTAKQLSGQVEISKSLSSQLEAEYGRRKSLLEAQLAQAEASGDEATAIKVLGNLKAEEVRFAGQSARAKRAEADAAETHVAALEKQAKATQGVDEEERKNIETAKANAAAVREAATAAEAHYQGLVKLPASLSAVRAEQALTTQEISRYKQSAEEALSAVQQMEALYRDGKISLAALADAQAAAAGKLEQYTQALKLQAEQLRANEAAISREAGLDRQRVVNKLEAVRAAEQAAKASGNETLATRLGIEAKRLEAQQEQVSADEKAKLAEAAAQVAANLEAQAETDGVLTKAEQESIQTAKDSAEAKRLEAEQSRIAAGAKRAEADATEKEANTKKSSKTATDEAKTSQDSLNQSQTDSVQILTAGEKALAAYNQAVNEFGNLDLGLKIANDSIDQKTQLESLKASLDSAANSGEKLGDAMRKAGLSSDLSGVSIEDLRRRFNLLDDADLSSLLSSVNSVRSAVQSLRDSTASTLSTLQDELDSLTGNEQARTEREYQTKKAELDAAYQQAANARDAQAQNSALEALRLLDEIHARKMAAFQEEEQAAKAQEDQKTTHETLPADSRFIPPETPRRQSPEPSAPVPAATRTILLDLRTDAGQFDAWTDNRGADVLDRIGRAQQSTRRSPQ